MEIRITVDAPELAAAIFALAESLEGGSWKPTPTMTATQADLNSINAAGAAVLQQVTETAKTEEKQPAKKVEKKPEPAPAPEEKPIPFETVRAKMAQVMAAVGVEKAKALVADLGFDGLSKVTPDKYPELMAAADAVLAK